MEPLSQTEIEFILDLPPINEIPPALAKQLLSKGFLTSTMGVMPGPIIPKPTKILHQIWNEYGSFFSERIVEALGAGVMGAAYLLTDGSVLKISSSQTELECVEKVYPIRNPHLPEVYEFGLINAFSPFFYYVREPLDDIPDLQYWSKKNMGAPWQWAEQLEPIAEELDEEYGIDIFLDYGPYNWGVRPGEPDTLVLRDLACA